MSNELLRWNDRQYGKTKPEGIGLIIVTVPAVDIRVRITGNNGVYFFHKAGSSNTYRILS